MLATRFLRHGVLCYAKRPCQLQKVSVTHPICAPKAYESWEARVSRNSDLTTQHNLPKPRVREGVVKEKANGQEASWHDEAADCSR